jgi:cytochrome bd-type quinol oxidase subunit 1
MTALPAAVAPALSPRWCAVAHAWMATPVHTQLTLEAARYEFHPDQLTALIVTTVVMGGMVDEILAIAAKS